MTDELQRERSRNLSGALLHAPYHSITHLLPKEFSNNLTAATDLGHFCCYLWLICRRQIGAVFAGSYLEYCAAQGGSKSLQNYATLTFFLTSTTFPTYHYTWYFLISICHPVASSDNIHCLWKNRYCTMVNFQSPLKAENAKSKRPKIRSVVDAAAALKKADDSIGGSPPLVILIKALPPTLPSQTRVSQYPQTFNHRHRHQRTHTTKYKGGSKVDTGFGATLVLA